MGLDTTHNAWHGSYTGFMQFRRAIARAAKLPPLQLMRGFYQHTEEQSANVRGLLSAIHRDLPIEWDRFADEPLVALLHHSDCDGEIGPADCAAIAKRLRELHNDIDDEWKQWAIRFAEGCERAAQAGEPLEFH